MARRSWIVIRFSKNMTSLQLLRQRILLKTSSMCTEASDTFQTFDQTSKRKDFRRMKAAIYKKNRQDSDLEKAARDEKLHIPLDIVRTDWMAKNEFSTTTKLARHYGIYEHMFKQEFTPSVRMLVKFGETDQVHFGNFLTPLQAFHEPTVDYDSSDDIKWTLIFANPDGNFIEKKKEFLHWMIGNIPGSRISDGQVLCEYLPPVPIKGTGFHRFVLCLLKQSGELDLGNYLNTQPRDIFNRTFSLSEFLSNHRHELIPAGLCFFQAAWDETVTRTFRETLGITEPVYKEQEFITPTTAKKILVRQWFESKYRNM